MNVSTRGPIVVIADDHDDNREMYADFMRVKGWRVAEAHNGEEAIRLVKELRPDALVLDLLMPHYGGMDALTTLRSNPQFRELPIVVVTAYDTLEMEAFTAGATMVCVKPCDPGVLLSHLQRLMPAQKRELS